MNPRNASNVQASGTNLRRCFRYGSPIEHKYEVRFAKNDPETLKPWTSRPRSHASLRGSWRPERRERSSLPASARTRIPARRGPTWSGLGRDFAEGSFSYLVGRLGDSVRSLATARRD